MISSAPRTEQAGTPRSEVVVVIPARGGSKGIPGKNLTEVAGRSLVRRAVEASRAAERVDLVLVSTDDEAIAREAQSAGATIVRRPDELSGDEATSESALVHALDSQNCDPDVVVLVQATSPFVWARDIDALVALVVEGGADSTFTATPTHGFLWRQGVHGSEGVNHDVVPRRRRQDLEAQFLETGAAYAMRVEGLRRTGHRFFGQIQMVEVPHDRSIEIDSPADLELARDAAQRVDRLDLASRLPEPLGAIIFDFDGVMTDNLVIVDQTGTESVLASRSDGLGIEMLRQAGVEMVVISKERNPVTVARCTKLQLELIHGVDDKEMVLTDWLERRSIDVTTVVYLGNDVNDVECMNMVGCAVAVADAHSDVLSIADVVLSGRGGHGAVRELADAILSRRGVSS